MSQVFKGKISEIFETRGGETAKGEWASVSFELTEFNPQNEQYAQKIKLDMFKNGEYVKYAKDFNQYYKVGDVVEASYNFKKQDYTNKQGQASSFYGVACWKLEKANVDSHQSQPVSQDVAPSGDKDGLPF
jgi:hypothetical protein